MNKYGYLTFGLLMSVAASTTYARGPAAFNSYDQNGDGAISQAEFQAFHDQQRVPTDNRRGQRLDGNSPVFSEFDIDKSGTLSPDELAAGQQMMMQKRGNAPGTGRRGMNAGHAGAEFSEFDRNGDGVLVESEFIESRNNRISERAGQGFMMRGLSNAREFSDIDSNGDGKVSPEEFFAAQAAHR